MPKGSLGHVSVGAFDATETWQEGMSLDGEPCSVRVAIGCPFVKIRDSYARKAS
jgi:hypothetical protein